MAKLILPKGATSQSLLVFAQSNTFTDGSGQPGLLYNSVDAYYCRPGSAVVTLTLATQTVTGAYTSGGFVAVDPSFMIGWYRFDVPDAVLATGVNSVGLTILNANIIPINIEIQLVDFNLNTSHDLYHARISFIRDQSNTKDEYTVTWFKNGVRITSGITSPTIQLIKRSDGSNLVSATGMTQIGSTGSYKYDESSNRLTLGESYVAVASATIDSATRTYSDLVGRDT